MRTKRTKDERLVNKFSKHKEKMAAESEALPPRKQTSTADDDCIMTEEMEEANLKVWNSILLAKH